jgi:putative NADH-flavin reductase
MELRGDRESGAIGELLIAELLKQGHSVVGMTTSSARAKNLEGA